MAKRKLVHDFAQTPGDFQVKMTKKSNTVQEAHLREELGETAYEHLEIYDPDQELSTNLLEELSPLIRLNDRQRTTNERKSTKPKKLNEQVLNNKVILVKPKQSHESIESLQVNESPGATTGMINGVVKSPVKSVSNHQNVNNIDKVSKAKLNLSDGTAVNFNRSAIKTSPTVIIKMQAADPKLLNDSNFKEKVRKFCEETGNFKSLDNSMVEFDDDTFNQPVNIVSKNKTANNSRVNNLTGVNKSVNKRVNSSNKKTVRYNNCYSSSSSSSSNNKKKNNSVNKKAVEISENRVSTTTDTTRSRSCRISRMNNGVDIIWKLMEKMKKRSTDIELQSKIHGLETFTDANQQPTVEELMVRLGEKDKQIEQLEEINQDLSEKLRKEKLTGNQLRINLMRYQKQVVDLKNELTLKTELMNEIYNASVRIRAYVDDEKLSDDNDDDDDVDDDDDFSQT